MKIIKLNENDLTRIIQRVINESKKNIIIESTDNIFVYTTKNPNKLSALIKGFKNPLDYINVPPKTKFRLTDEKKIIAWKGSIEFICKGKFYTKKGEYVSDNLAKVLKSKFCKGNVVKDFFDKQLSSPYMKDNRIYVKGDSKNCMGKVRPLYNNAVNWWKKKLDEPMFFKKLKRLNNYSDSQTKDIIKKYKYYLSNKFDVFCPKKGTKLYRDAFRSGSIAFAYVDSTTKNVRVVYNEDYLNESAKDIESTMVHEIQHGLYDGVKPMTPEKNWKKVLPYNVWGNDLEVVTPEVKTNKKQISSKYGIDISLLEGWEESLKQMKNPKERKDPNYECRITEQESRLVGLKKLLNYNTSQKITVNDFKKFIEAKTVPYNDEQAWWFVICWVNNGMEDIKTFLDKLDKNVVAKKENQTDDKQNDQIT